LRIRLQRKSMRRGRGRGSRRWEKRVGKRSCRLGLVGIVVDERRQDETRVNVIAGSRRAWSGRVDFRSMSMSQKARKWDTTGVQQ